VKPILILFSLAFFFFYVPFQARSQTDILGGDISGSWTSAGSPYRIFGDLKIPNDSSLIIDAGVKIEFQDHYTINVQGNLQANGSVTDSIYFSINDTTGFSDPNITAGGWNGVRIIDTIEDNDSSIFEYCVFQYGKAVAPFWYVNAGGAICIINFSKVRISHCLFNHNSAGGSEVPAGGAIHMAWSDIKLTDNIFTYNRADAGGAIQMHESDPVFNRNFFANNYAKDGGGISVGTMSNPTFYNDTIMNNVASQLGGGIMCWDKSEIIFDEVIIEGNEASWGGGLGMSSVKVYVNDCKVLNNTAENLGGGIASDFSNVSINNSEIISNSASMSGGIHAWYDTLDIDDCEISQNIADYGGGIHADFSQLELMNSLFSENQAINGGGIHIWNSDLNITQCEFTGNNVTYEGGAMDLNLGDTLVFDRPYLINIKQSQLIENNADFRSGGMKIEQTDTLISYADIHIDQCIFDKNHAERIAALRIVGMFQNFRVSNSRFTGNLTDLWNGGTSFSLGCNGKVTNCLFTDNHAAGGSPGASGVSNGALVHYINCTFVNNTAASVGALSAHRDGIASITNCIFWNNSPRQIWVKGLREDAFSEMYVNYCNIQFGIDSVETDTLAALYWGEGNIDSDPLFLDPDNGDFQLMDDSPCIDAGIDSVEVKGQWLIAPDSDIEGLPRPQAGATRQDLGVYENQDVLALKNESQEDRFLIRTYPNPASEQLHFEIALKQPAWINIRIYDFLGTEITELAGRNMGRGRHQISWNTEEIGSGLYICRINVSNEIISRKILIIR
jgi:hypothetical protein